MTQASGTSSVFLAIYNLDFMQQLEDRADPAWIGACNELNGSLPTSSF
jgi:indolepyruvate decarboxylase